MYYQHFGFNNPPFKITPDTSLFFPGGNRGAILEALNYAVRNGEGIVKVVGEVGSGKTMLCRMLELELPSNIDIVYLANPRVSPEHILHAIAFELKLPIRDEGNQLVLLQKIQEYLLGRHADNRQVVMFIEEAQGMPLATLEEIRLLSNLETNQHKLLQIVLFGQPELDETLAKPQIRQLKERITYNFKLEPLKRSEIRDYLTARLRSCGYRGSSLFKSGAIAKITRYSKGLLRRVNILADKSLLAAYAGNSQRVGRRHVMAAVKDSDFNKSWLPWFLWPAALSLLVAVGGFLYYNRDARLTWDLGSIVAPAGSPAVTETEESEPFDAGASAVPPGSETSAVTVKSEQTQEPGQVVELDLQPLGEGFARTFDFAETRSSANNTTVAVINEPAVSPRGDIVERAPETTGLVAGDVIIANGITKVLQQQLHKLPPEEVWMDAPSRSDVTCDRCAAIIYRPVQEVEKL